MKLLLTGLSRTAPLLLAALALASTGPTARAQTGTRTRVDTTFAFTRGSWVDLGLVSGEIVVTGWTRPEVHVAARNDEGDLETTLSSNRISIQARSRRSLCD